MNRLPITNVRNCFSYILNQVKLTFILKVNATSLMHFLSHITIGSNSTLNLPVTAEPTIILDFCVTLPFRSFNKDIFFIHIFNVIGTFEMRVAHQATLFFSLWTQEQLWRNWFSLLIISFSKSFSSYLKV